MLARRVCNHFSSWHAKIKTICPMIIRLESIDILLGARSFLPRWSRDLVIFFLAGNSMCIWFRPVRLGRAILPGELSVRGKENEWGNHNEFLCNIKHLRFYYERLEDFVLKDLPPRALVWWSQNRRRWRAEGLCHFPYWTLVLR